MANGRKGRWRGRKADGRIGGWAGKFNIPEATKQGSGEELFGFLADSVGAGDDEEMRVGAEDDAEMMVGRWRGDDFGRGGDGAEMTVGVREMARRCAEGCGALRAS